MHFCHFGLFFEFSNIKFFCRVLHFFRGKYSFERKHFTNAFGAFFKFLIRAHVKQTSLKARNKAWPQNYWKYTKMHKIIVDGLLHAFLARPSSLA